MATLVTRADLERSLAHACTWAHSPRAGLFGPGSMSWQVNRETIVLLAGGAAALLQLAHPYVAHAVAEHSRTRDDVLGRFQRTFEHVLAMAFGDLDHAMSAARRVHRIHERVHGRIPEDSGPFARGHAYHANDVDALFWVHATLIDRALAAYQAVVRPLGAPECERYYQESKRFGYLFGIPDSAMPADMAGFRAYMAEMLSSNLLTVTADARAMARFLLSPTRSVDASVWYWYRIMTAGFLPARQRADFGLDAGRASRLLFRASLGALAPLYRALPESARCFPEYLDVAGHPRTADQGPRIADRVQHLLRALLARRAA